VEKVNCVIETGITSMVWKKDGFKYLGMFLGKGIIVLKNWEDVIEKIEGKLSKWKWLLPQMSFK
ncbi:hypothetical protein NHX12_014885, partial [Muraenolepis orangiensis]